MERLGRLRTFTLCEVKDEHLGTVDPEKSDKDEYELQLDLFGRMIRQACKERNLTQSELSEMIGVRKSQISRIERNAKNVTIDTILRVFRALEGLNRIKARRNMNKF